MDDIFPETPSLHEEVKLLSDDEVQKIIRLNAKLFEVEKQISENKSRLTAELEAKKASGEIYDYEIETTVQYFSSALGGVILESFGCVLRHCNREEFDDWNDRQFIEHPLFTMKHSWLFHDLYDHVDLSLRAISMIDSAIWESKVTEEHAVIF